MISISTPTFDLGGSLIIRGYDPSTDFRSKSRRVSRTATLDGGCVIEDNGLSHSDRTFRIISSSLSEADVIHLNQLIGVYSILYISTREGIFKGVIETLGYNRGAGTISFLIKEKIA